MEKFVVISKFTNAHGKDVVNFLENEDDKLEYFNNKDEIRTLSEGRREEHRQFIDWYSLNLETMEIDGPH